MGVGARRATIQHPGLELVGLVVHSEGKEGRDAGDLCGLPLTGVIATRDIDRALSIDADVVAYFATGDYRYREAVDDVVTTSLVPFCYPPAAEPDQPVPRDGRLEDDIAPVVGFLLSDASACVTGQTLMPDGSRVMLR